MNSGRYQLVQNGHKESILDTEGRVYVFHLPEGMMGVRTDTRDLARKVVAFLNSGIDISDDGNPVISQQIDILLPKRL